MAGLELRREPVSAPPATATTSPVPQQQRPCRTPHLTWPRKSYPTRSTLEGERKQVTVLFADLKGSMELLADRDPEEARRLLDRSWSA